MKHLVKIFLFFSSNIKIENLYKDGLQRDQFISFIKILKRYCGIRSSIDNDYRLEKGELKIYSTY